MQSELRLHLTESLVGEITNLQKLIIGAVHQFADCRDSFGLQAIRRAHGKFEFIERPVELLFEADGFSRIASPRCGNRRASSSLTRPTASARTRPAVRLPRAPTRSTARESEAHARGVENGTALSGTDRS